jgi:calcium-dependent protein kinase
VLKIIDFGMSKYTQSRTYERQMAGTSFYMAPEVLDSHYTYHCDMWSFGVVTFIMLFGFPPFTGESDRKIHQRIMEGFNPVTKSGYGAFFPKTIKVSDAAKDLIAKLLHSDPAIRLTAEEALEHSWFTSALDNDTPLAPTFFAGLKEFTANSAFKQAVLGALSSSLSETDLEELQTAFKRMDLDGDGKITINELKTAMSGQDSKAAQSIQVSVGCVCVCVYVCICVCMRVYLHVLSLFLPNTTHYPHCPTPGADEHGRRGRRRLPQLR